MKKGLLTIIVSLFILIPISVNAGQLSCEYKLESTIGDDYGTLTIAKNDSGAMFINGYRVGNGDIELGKINGKSVTLYYSSAPNVSKEIIDYIEKAAYINYCDQIKECENSEIPNEPRGSSFDCVAKRINTSSIGAALLSMITPGSIKPRYCLPDNVKVDNQDAYLNSVFNSSSCPTINFAIVDNKDFTKKYLIFLNPKEAKGSTLYASIYGAGAIKQDGALTNIGTQINNDIEDVPFCGETSGFLKAFKIVGYVIFVIKILIPIALIIYGSIDFFKAMTSNSDDNIKKATSAIIQRAIIAVMIFFIPTLVYYFVGLLGNAIKRDDPYFKNCNTCLLKPDQCVARDREKVINQEMGNDINENNN